MANLIIILVFILVGYFYNQDQKERQQERFDAYRRMKKEMEKREDGY